MPNEVCRTEDLFAGTPYAPETPKHTPSFDVSGVEAFVTTLITRGLTQLELDLYKDQNPHVDTSLGFDRRHWDDDFDYSYDHYEEQQKTDSFSSSSENDWLPEVDDDWWHPDFANEEDSEAMPHIEGSRYHDIQYR